VIEVRKHDSLGGDGLPRNFGMSGLEVGGNLASSFADYLNYALNRQPTNLVLLVFF
jgi:hypothetical protein